MTKSFKCVDVGKNCSWSVQTDTTDELLEKISEHAHHDHGIHEISDVLKSQVESAIKNI